MKNYVVNSKNIDLNGKDFKSFFTQLNEACAKVGTKYFIVGAFARDLILEQIYKQKPNVGTRDIDLALRMESWEKYEEFISLLFEEYGFEPGRKVHEYISSQGVLTDIVPYGKIEEERKISFPPHFTYMMNMLGFEEIYDYSMTILLDEEIEIRIASVESLVLLKLIAWHDRYPTKACEKHARDICIVIECYFDIKIEEFADKYGDIFDDVEEEFDPFLWGARVIGRHIACYCKGATQLIKQLDVIFDEILKQEDNCLFASQMAEVNYLNYEECLNATKWLQKGIKEGLITEVTPFN